MKQFLFELPLISRFRRDRLPQPGRPFTPLVVLLCFAATASGEELTIEQCIAKALNSSTMVSAAESNYQAAQEKRRGAWANAGPRVSVGYNEAYFKEPQVVQFGPQSITMRPDTVKTGNITVAQPVTGLYAVSEYASLQGVSEDMAEQSLHKSRRDTAFGVAESYLQAYLTEQQEKIAEESLNAAQSQFKDASAMANVGRLGQSDLLKFQLALSQASTRLAQARAGKNLAFTSLKLAIGVSPAEALALGKELPQVKPFEAPQGEARDLIKQRIEYREAELRKEAAHGGVKVAMAQFIPNINLFAKLDRNFGETGGLGAEKETRSYGVSLQWDIWSNGSSFFAVREAREQSAGASHALQSASDGLYLELVQAIDSSRVAVESLKLAEDAVKQADEAYRIDVIRFKAGQISATELIQSESLRSSARGQLVAAQTQALIWNFRLQKATGAMQPKI
jgi:outer membrane protein